MFSKIDELDETQLHQKMDAFEKKYGIRPMPISAILHEGVEELKNKILERLVKIPKKPPVKVEMFDFDKPDLSSVQIRQENRTFIVEGGKIDNFVRGVVLDDPRSFAYFQTRLQEMGIIELLKQKGLKNGDIVKIKNIEFEWIE